MRHLGLRVLLAFCLSIGALALVTPAHASFGDCNSPAYLARFDSRLGRDTGFLCVESELVPIATGAGTANVRIIQHLVSDWALAPGAMRSFKNGVAAVAGAAPALGSFRMQDVTILLVDGFGPGGGSERFGDIAAWTRYSADGECLITVWLLGPGARAEYGAAVVAHEIFHCIQNATLRAEQVTSGAAAWWQEGSADWFVTLAMPPPAFMADRVRSFDGRSATTPLNRMTYDGYVFFAWLGGARGPAGVITFLNRMASSAGEGAQRSAMAAALPTDQWQRFGQDYWDRNIRDGQRTSIGSTPVQGDAWDWSDTATRRIDMTPFVIRRGTLTFHCGRWTVRPAPARFHAAKPTDGGEWAPVPNEIDAMNIGAAGKSFQFIGVNTSGSDLSLAMAATLSARCGDCAGVRELDRCLVGEWQMSVSGAAAWARANLTGVAIPVMDASGNHVSLRPDGVFVMGQTQTRSEVRALTDPVVARGGLNARGSGRWSAARAKINMCMDDIASSGTVNVQGPGYNVTVPMGPIAATTTSTSYTCNATTMTMTQPMPRGTTMTNIFTRTSPPPPGR